MEARRDSGRLVWGILLLVLGLIFLLRNFGYGWWFGWGRWWPLILIAIGVVMLYRRSEWGAPAAPPAPAAPGEPGTTAPVPEARRRYPTGAIVLIGIGLAFLLDDVIGGNAFPALVLMAIGVAVLLRDRASR